MACLNDLLAMARQWRDATAHRRDGTAPALHLFITPPGTQAVFRTAGVNWPNDFALHNQRGRTLGDRMADALERVRRGAPLPCAVLLVGSDLPLLTATHLDAALEALAGARVVFGPTADGGYYLVGMRFAGSRGVPPHLFDLSGWGEEDVLAQSLARAADLGLAAATIDPLPDADTPEHLPALLAHPLAGTLRGRSSLRWLRRHGPQAPGGPFDAR